MQTKKKNKKKPLLVLGAMATLSGQFSTDLALIAYASTSTQASQLADANTKSTKLTAIQKGKYRYDLTDLTTETLPSVQIEKGVAGQTLKESFLIEKEDGTSHLSFNLTLAGPTDSKVVVKVNGVTYLEQTVGRGQLNEASFFFLEEENALVEIEYTVGSGEEVLPSQPWLKFSNMVVNTQTAPTRPLEYRVKGDANWISYDSSKGIEAIINTKDDFIPLEIRYTDVENPEVFDLTIEAPSANNPLLLVQSDGLFYLNHFNTPYNGYQSLSVRFNNRDWQKYTPGMVLELINNECLVDVKVVNDYGVETILPTQRYQFPELKQAVMSETDGTVTLSSPNIKELNTKIEYQVNGGEWMTYQDSFELDMSKENQLSVRISDIYGRSLEETHMINTQSSTTPETPNESNSNQSTEENDSDSESNSTESTEENNSNSESNSTESTEENNSNSESSSTESTEENNSNSESSSTESTEENNSSSESNSTESTEEIIKPSLTFPSETLKVEYGSNLDYESGVTLEAGNATDVKYTLVKSSFNSKKVGEQTVQYQLSYKQNGKSYKETVYRTVEVIGIDPTLTFTSTPLKVKYNSNLNYKSGVKLSRGSATNVTYSLVEESFNPKKVGEQTIQYQLNYTQGGESYSKTINRTIEVTGIDPTLTFSGGTLKVQYGSDFDYKSGATLKTGSATDITYSLVEDSFNPKQVGKQTVQYQLEYKQGIKSYSKTINRTIEVTKIDPTLTFSSTPLTVQYGSDFNYESGATLETGSATDVKYSLVESSFNPKKVGKQTVKYQLSYKQGTKSYKKTISRTVEVIGIDPTLTFSSTPLTVAYGSNLDYKSGIELSNGSATNVKYSLVRSSFNSKQVGEQTVQYELSYKQGTKSYKKTISRTIEVTAVDPTLTFSKNTLTARYGKTPNFKTGVTVKAGSATDVTYSIVDGSYNPEQRGTQKVQYQLSYKQSGKSYSTIIERDVIVK